MGSHIYLAKDSNDLISHCRCTHALVTFPAQMNCPWCGCGWLFTCIECRKAFTFASGIEVNESWEDTARRDITNKWGDATQQDVSDWVAAMEELLADVEVGGRYVYLDGAVIPVEERTVRFDGWHSRHDFDCVPQIAALADYSIVQQVLSNAEYWQRHALKHE